jgi:SAM-dependent methyltransferase
MKTVVSLQDLLERDIKPNALLAEYLALTRASIAAQWRSHEALVPTACPGCGAEDSDPAFERGGFTYRSCPTCGSVYVSPRPTEASLVAYYRDSAAARFWRERILPETAEARAEKLVGPRADWVLDAVAEYAPGARTALDVSPYGAPLAHALLRAGALQRVVAASGQADVDYDRAAVPGLEVRPSPIASLPSLGPVDVALAFDALERASDAAGLVRALRDALRPGGLLFVTAPNVSGFELQVLWDRSPTIAPPDKLNLLSIEGFQRLFAAPGWEIVEFSTPGMFDLESVRRAVLAEPSHDWPRFIRRLVERGDETAHAEFQEFLQRQRLASFARLVLRRTS